MVVSSGIEPESRASETLILSIVLRDQNHILFDQPTQVGREYLNGNSQQNYAKKLSYC